MPLFSGKLPRTLLPKRLPALAGKPAPVYAAHAPIKNFFNSATRNIRGTSGIDTLYARVRAAAKPERVILHDPVKGSTYIPRLALDAKAGIKQGSYKLPFAPESFEFQRLIIPNDARAAAYHADIQAARRELFSQHFGKQGPLALKLWDKAKLGEMPNLLPPTDGKTLDLRRALSPAESSFFPTRLPVLGSVLEISDLRTVFKTYSVAPV